MSNFELFLVPRILFGCGQFNKIGQLAGGLGRSALVVTNLSGGGGRTLERLAELLAEAGVRHEVFRVAGEPEVEDLDRGLAAAGAMQAELLIGLGGGSAIDTAKAVAGLLANGGAALDYMEVIGQGRRLSRQAAPWIAAPTTAGTGAEVTRNAVIGFKQKHFKASIRSEHLLARVALVDPELTVSVPPEVTAATGMDALTQCLEAYTSNAAQPATDALALEGLRRAGRSLRRAYENGTDLEAREDLSLAALFSGICLAHAGLGAVHGCASPLGARFPAPHGSVCAALLAPVVAANVAALRRARPESPALARYAQAARVLTSAPALRDDDAIDAGLRAIRELVRDLKIPGLGRFGAREEHLAELARSAKKASSMKYNPIELTEDQLSGALHEAL
jgi:alcohol dehydrogenase class IV